MNREFPVLMAAVLMACRFLGCAGSQPTSQPPPFEPNRDAALERYLNGLVFDQKGEFANAILEYQDALRYDHDPAIYNALARDYSAIDKQPLAVQMGMEAVRLDPENRSYHESLGDIYRRAFEFDLAIREYEDVIRIDSGYVQGWHDAAGLIAIRQPHRALEMYNRIIDRFGPDWSAYLQMAQLQSALGNHRGAAEALKGLLGLDPSNAEIKKALGDAYLRMDSVDAALRQFQELVELHPEDITLRASVAHASLLKHDYDRAAEQFDSVMQRDSLSVDEQIQFGQVFISFLQQDSSVAPIARQLFERIQTKYPGDWRPYWFLGALANMERDDSTALSNFQQVTRLAGWNPDGWVGVASVWYDRGRFQEAVDVLHDAERFVPDEFRVHFLLGITYQRMHLTSDAALSLERALQLNEKNVDALSALALVYDDAKRYDESDSLYERALRLDPHNHLLLNNYGYSLADRGIDIDRALRMAKEALGQQPANQSYLDTMGWVYFRMGEYEEAERFILKALELGSTSAVIHEHLGDIYSKQNKKEKALEYWQRALELDGSNQGLKNKIQRGSL